MSGSYGMCAVHNVLYMRLKLHSFCTVSHKKNYVSHEVMQKISSTGIIYFWKLLNVVFHKVPVPSYQCYWAIFCILAILTIKNNTYVNNFMFVESCFLPVF